MDRHFGAALDFEIHVRAVRQNQAGDNQNFQKKILRYGPQLLSFAPALNCRSGN
jgi:hypothetical protein